MARTDRKELESQGSYFRFYLWCNRGFARLIVLLASVIESMGRPLPAQIRQQGAGFARVLRLLARLIVQPTYIRIFMAWRPTLKGMLDGALLGGILGFWTAYYLIDEPALFNVLAWTICILLALTFGLLTNFLFVSGDVYFGSQDEFQKASASEASASTLHLIFFILLILFIAYLIRPVWRNAVPFHLSMLYCIARLTYLFRLTQLRWREVADAEMAQEDEEQQGDEEPGIIVMRKRGEA